MEAWLSVMGIRAPVDTNVPSPKNCFGFFVTWYNGTKVHGCIGRYNKDFTKFTVTKNALSNISKSSAFENTRKTTNTPWTEPNMKCEVSLMLGPPLMKPGSPATTGIVVVNGPRTATFLPGVFRSKTPWNLIKKQLLEKAGVQSGTFYYYKTKTIEMTTHKALRQIGAMYAKNLLRTSFPLRFKDPSDNVRNASFVGDLLRYNRMFKILPLSKVVVLKKLLAKFKNEKLGGQVDAFLALSGVNTCARLKRALPDAEKVFELGQISLALVERCRNTRGVKMILDAANTNDIFQANWYFQALQAAHKLGPRQELVARKLLATVGPSSETNYLAVGIELASQFNTFDTERIRLLRLLAPRTTPNYLFAFLNGTTRVDITTHVINGLLKRTHT